MKQLNQILEALPEYQSILAQLEAGRSPIAVSGLSDVHRAQLAAALHLRTGRPLLLLCSDEQEGQRLQRDLAFFTEEPAELLAGREFVFHNATASRQWEHRRLKLLRGLQCCRAPVTVATVEGLFQRTLPPAALARAVCTLRVGSEYNLEELTHQLVAMGYVRCEQVEGPGQFARRGFLLDVYSPAAELPVRAEFWGEEIDTLSFFDPATQRRREPTQETELLPAA